MNRFASRFSTTMHATPGTDRARRAGSRRPASIRAPWCTVRAAVLAAVLGAGAAPVHAGAVVLAGVVRSLDAQPIYTPPSNSWPVVLRYYVPEGTVVAAGDPLVRIDPGQSLTQTRTLVAQIEQARARMEKEIAELAVKAIDAEVALVDAHTALEKARIDAAVPPEHVSALDHDRYRGEFERATREHALKQRELEAATDAIARRRKDGDLEVAKLEADLRYHQAQVANAEVRAERAGVVVHGFDNHRGGRIDEGSSAGPGTQIGEVVGDGAMGVLAWALEPDRAQLAEGQAVRLAFDALPGSALDARIERIAGAPDVKAEWGEGRYFELEITLPPGAAQLPLRPGMSVRVEAAVAAPSVAP